MLALVTLTAALAASGFGYYQAREFVRRRLRFVGAIHRPLAPALAALGAALATLPLVAVLPLVGAGTAILFGLGVGLGVAAGRRDIRRRLPPEL